MIETQLVEKWLYDVLSSDAGEGGVATLVDGRIYAYHPPQAATYPLVLYSLLSGIDVMTVGACRVLVNSVYIVKVVDRSDTVSFAGIKPVADRIDLLLHDTQGEVESGRVLTCTREGVVSYAEFETQFTLHLGGRYRILAQET